MNLLHVVCFGFVGFFAAVHCTLVQGNQIILTGSSRSVTLPELDTQVGNDFSCSWKIISSDDKIIQVELKKFLSNTKCDCDCGRISVAQGLNKKLYCQKDLPATLESNEGSLDIVFESDKNIIGHNLEKTPLFRYDIKSKHRSKRESGNGSIANTKPNESRNASMNNSVATGNTDSGTKLTRLPVLLPAIFTVVIFVACVACIAYKNYNIEEFPFSGSVPDITEEKVDICCSAKRRKNARKHSKNELYDVMLKQYKAETFMKHPSRKSSTINVVGAEGNDPQSIARKHIILRHMRDPRKSSGAVEALIKLSSKALIASSMGQNEKENGNKPGESLSMLLEDEPLPQIDSLPTWQQENLDSFSDSNVEDIPTEKRFSTDEKSYLICPPENNSKKRNSGSAWFKYKRLEKQSFVDDDDSDEELKYDCAQHIQRILSASKENLEEAKRILPDDVKDIVLPEDLEAALAEFEFWPDSSV